MKRARGSTLTGGTGDYNPQTYSISVLQTAIDTTTTASFPTPIPRFGTGGSTTSPVMEVLKVFFVVDDLAALSQQTTYIGSLSTSDITAPGTFGVNLIADPRVFAFFSLDGIYLTAAGFATASRVFEFDLTDGSGRGLLVATDNIFFHNFTSGTGRANNMIAKILYRMKNVTLQEYVGIVQSQQ